ncbi:MAG: glycoside hydrolase family 9 protein, partial [Oscillospiraceae bacterium]|nr:glycoside hydrolase family 9 protein [Oscillospiraceae bacterium]
GDMYFTVKNDFTIENGYIDSIQLAAPTHPQDGNKQWLFNFEKNIIIKSIYVETSTNTETIKVYEASGLDGTTFRSGVLFEKQSNETSKIKFQENSYNEFNITYVEIIDADGLLYVYGSKSTTTSARSSAVENNVLAQADGNKTLPLPSYNNSQYLFEFNNPINVSSIYIKADRKAVIYEASENLNGKEVPTETIVDLGNTSISKIKLQPAKGEAWDDFQLEYVELTASDGIKYVYDPNNTGGGSGDPGGSGEDPGGGSSSEPITNPNLSVSGNLLTVKNKLKGDETDVEVAKKWEDGSFQTGRSEITVQLYRSTKAIPFDQLATKLTEADKVEDKTATLNTDNGWTYKWENLPARSTEDDPNNPGKKLLYHYYVQETGVPSGYTVSYSQEGDKLVVTNTLKTIDLNVKKVWSVPNGVTVEKPDRLEVKLQWKNGENWEDVPGVAHLTLTADATGVYESKFENLPEGKTYRAVEVSIPTGWKLFGQTESNIDGGMLTITNEAILGELQVKKEWNGDTESDRPAEVKLKLYRSTTSSSNTGSTSSGTAPNFDPNLTSNLYPVQTVEEVQEDYARLLQYSLYFYDANMCGDTVEETSAYSWRKNCHTYDGDYAGGFHDAGDHVMYGLPQGFAASTLGWSYYEFKDSFDNLGITDHYQTIVKEFCDFFVKSTKLENGTVSSILVQKGNDGADHKTYWGPPEIQTEVQRGGLIWSSDSGSNIAANYAAALAQYYLNFPNDPNRDNYLDYAEALYIFSINKNSVYSGDYYPDSTYVEEQAWAAAWLYLATEQENYKLDCKNKLSGLTVPSRGYFWENTTLGAATVYTTRIDPTDTAIKAIVTNFLSKCNGTNFIVFGSTDEWGSIRHNTLTQTVALIYDKHQTNPTYQEWCKGQMAYILGNNQVASNGKSSTCFVTGFADNSAMNIHHKAASNIIGESDWSGWNSWDGLYSSAEGSHTIVGALVGGRGDNSNYKDNCKDHVGNEVALDYNAGLVAAAAGLYSVYHTGSTYSNVTQSSQPQQTSSNSAVQEKNVALMQAAEWEAEGVLSNDTATVSDDGNATKSVRAAGTSDMDFVQIVGATDDINFTCNSSSESSVYEYNNLNYQNIIQIEIVLTGTMNGGFSFHYNNYAGGDNWIQFSNSNPFTKIY